MRQRQEAEQDEEDWCLVHCESEGGLLEEEMAGRLRDVGASGMGGSGRKADLRKQ